MLQIVLTPRGTSPKPGEAPPVNGPFVVQSRTPQETVFTANPTLLRRREGPAEGNRRAPLSDGVARPIAALKRGDIDVLDRVNPWHLAALCADTHLVVQPYALPLVHCLIPNIRRPLLSDRTFRRALAYGIYRQRDPPADARRRRHARLRGHQQSVSARRRIRAIRWAMPRTRTSNPAPTSRD